MEEIEYCHVTVNINGEDVLTLASNYICGKDLSEQDEEVIRSCAHRLLSFVGEKKERNGKLNCIKDDLPF